MARIILVSGGSRSGKSNYALEKAESFSKERLFIATCPVVDDELSERVQAHREERIGRGWLTVEEELDLAKVLQDAPQSGVVLIDCLTLWINNLIFSQPNDFSFNKVWLEQQIETWYRQSCNLNGNLILVTGEVGLGIVPENSLSRLYRDLVGWCNQLVAARADEVYLVSCGLPLQLK